MSEILTWGPGLAPLGTAVVSIGVFDGVHVGHQALVRDARELAHERGVSSAVITFDRDPDRVVDPDAAAPQLLELEDKIDLLAAQGPDIVLVIPFDPHVAAMGPETFLDELLLPVFEPAAVVVGHDFRFGARAAGDIGTLRAYGLRHGFAVAGHPLVRIDGEPVTSTRVRSLVAAGDMAGATALLGRPHRLRGVVEQGRHIGRGLGAPTANVAHAPYAAVPRDGVYAATATVDEGTYAAAVSIGPPLTFPGAPAAVEAHLLDFAGDLYGGDIMLSFLARLRGLERFDGPEALSRAIADDVRHVRSIVSAEA